MCLMIILKVTKNQGFTLSLEDTLFKKPQDRGGKGCGEGQIDPTQPFYGYIITLQKEFKWIRSHEHLHKSTYFLYRNLEFSLI